MADLRKTNDPNDIILIALANDSREIVVTCVATNSARYFVHAKPQAFDKKAFDDCQQDEEAVTGILAKMGYKESAFTPAVIARLVYAFRWHLDRA